MKKILSFLLVLFCAISLTGCEKETEKTVLSKLSKKIDKVLLEKIKNDIKFTEITLSIIASKYKLAPSTISEINFGKIGFDKNEEYPLRKNAISISNRGQKNGRAIFSDVEVLEIRKKFVEMDLNQLYE